MSERRSQERRRRISAGEVGDALAKHERECAERYNLILTEFRESREEHRAFRQEIKPVLEIYQASSLTGRALVKAVSVIAALSAIVAAWFKFKGGGA